MKQDEIIEMATEIWNTGSSFPIPSSDDILQFAKLVEEKATAKEREACAKVCDVLAVHPEYASEITKLVALAIRARGQA